MKYALLVLVLVVGVAAPAMADEYPNRYSVGCPNVSSSCK
jgi:hypothetical protein